MGAGAGLVLYNQGFHLMVTASANSISVGPKVGGQLQASLYWLLSSPHTRITWTMAAGLFSEHDGGHPATPRDEDKYPLQIPTIGDTRVISYPNKSILFECRVVQRWDGKWIGCSCFDQSAVRAGPTSRALMVEVCTDVTCSGRSFGSFQTLSIAKTFGGLLWWDRRFHCFLTFS